MCAVHCSAYFGKTSKMFDRYRQTYLLFLFCIFKSRDQSKFVISSSSVKMINQFGNYYRSNNNNSKQIKFILDTKHNPGFAIYAL